MELKKLGSRFFLSIILTCLCLLIILVPRKKSSFLMTNVQGQELRLTFSKPLYRKYYNRLEISQGQDYKRYDFKGQFKLNIWKYDSGDTDGDGVEELALGVFTRAPHHNIMAKRVFLYNIDGLDLKAKFRASRLVNPMEDFILYDLDQNGIDNIVSIEKYGDDYFLAAYYQYDLLIERLYKSRKYKALKNLQKSNYLWVEEDGQRKKIYLEEKEMSLK